MYGKILFNTYFFAIVIMRLGNAIVEKTRYNITPFSTLLLFSLSLLSI